MTDIPERPSKDHRLTIDLTPSLAKGLKEYQEDHPQHPAAAQVIRIALEQFLSRAKKKGDKSKSDS